MDYSVLSDGRRETFQRFGKIYDLPIIPSSYDYIKKAYRGGKILDVGAGKELYLRQLLNLDERVYFSLDNDPGGVFSYQQPEDIPDDMIFEWMVFNQVLEHLTIDQASHLLIKLRPYLLPGGQVIISVPNIFHPTRFWATTHVTPWSYTDLTALCEERGYSVQQIYRYSKIRRPLDPLSWLVERIMRRLYRIDWCDNIMLVATG